MRRRPQLPQAVVDRDRIGHRLRAAFAPGRFAGYDLDRALVGTDWLGRSAARREFALAAHGVHSHRRRLVVDRNVVAALDEARPPLAWHIGLTEAEQLTAAGIFDRVEIGCAHRVRDGGEPGLLLGTGANRKGCAQPKQNRLQHPHVSVPPSSKIDSWKKRSTPQTPLLEPTIL